MTPSDYTRTLVDLWATGARDWVIGQEQFWRTVARGSAATRDALAGDDDPLDEGRPDCASSADLTERVDLERTAALASDLALGPASPRLSYEPAASSARIDGARLRRPILVVPSLLASTAPPVATMVAALGRAGAVVHIAHEPGASSLSFAGIVHALDVYLTVLDAGRETAPASVVALGDGGLIALVQAALAPERQRNLVLVATSVDFFADPLNANSGPTLIATLARRLTADDVDRLLNAYDGLPVAWLSNHPPAEAKVVGCSCQAAAPMARDLARTLLTDIYGENQLIEGCLRVGGRSVDLRNVRSPILALASASEAGDPGGASLALAACVGSQDYADMALSSSIDRDNDEPANDIIQWLASRDEPF